MRRSPFVAYWTHCVYGIVLCAAGGLGRRESRMTRAVRDEREEWECTRMTSSGRPAAQRGDEPA
jgi:hypothetical protein